MTSEVPQTQPQELTSPIKGVPASEPTATSSPIEPEELTLPIADVPASEPTPKSEGTMGFTCTTEFIRNLIRMISLGKIFPEIVLHFDGNIVWWSNKVNGFVFSNFGFFSYNHIEKCWGKGTVGLPSQNLLDFVEFLGEYEKVTFWTHPNNKIFYIKTGDIDGKIEIKKKDGKIETKIIPDTFNNHTIPIENIKTSRESIIKLDTDYIPFVPPIFKENGKLQYGFDINISWIKSFAKRAKKYHNHISIALSPEAPYIEINFNLGNGNNTIQLGKESKVYTKLLENISNLKVPPKKTVYVIKADSFKSIAENYPRKEKVSFRVSNIDFHPIYLLRKEIHENDKSFLVSAVFIQTLNRVISIAEDKKARSEYL